MPAATRNGDKCTGHDACPPVPLVECSPYVSINKLGAGRVGDHYSTHGCVSHPGHQDVIAAGSSTVAINGRPAARTGDTISIGGTVALPDAQLFFYSPCCPPSLSANISR